MTYECAKIYQFYDRIEISTIQLEPLSERINDVFEPLSERIYDVLARECERICEVLHSTILIPNTQFNNFNYLAEIISTS